MNKIFEYIKAHLNKKLSPSQYHLNNILHTYLTCEIPDH